MDEKHLTKIAFFGTILGLLFLWGYSQQVHLESFAHLDELPSEKEITVRGIVTKISQQEKAWFLEVDGETIEKVPVVLFPEEDIFLQEGDYVEIAGQTKNYKGKKEIVASEVVVK
ncbi:hypothetical protein HYX13_01725 [Candidatus Woesearchaeota archaeon]|nr:hypothetical protein [Candidatus Woesearchaeota archaeon]